jgi:hypothetical protein
LPREPIRWADFLDGPAFVTRRSQPPPLPPLLLRLRRHRRSSSDPASLANSSPSPRESSCGRSPMTRRSSSPPPAATSWFSWSPSQAPSAALSRSRHRASPTITASSTPSTPSSPSPSPAGRPRPHRRLRLDEAQTPRRHLLRRNGRRVIGLADRAQLLEFHLLAPALRTRPPKCCPPPASRTQPCSIGGTLDPSGLRRGPAAAGALLVAAEIGLLDAGMEEGAHGGRLWA